MMDKDLAEDLLTNLSNCKTIVRDSLKMLQGCKDTGPNSDLFNDLIQCQRYLSDVVGYLETQV